VENKLILIVEQAKRERRLLLKRAEANHHITLGIC